MNLKEFIQKLESISLQCSDPEMVEVKMADGVPIVNPVFDKEGESVCITDIDPYMEEINELLNS